jgi:hypothetical protein
MKCSQGMNAGIAAAAVAGEEAAGLGGDGSNNRPLGKGMEARE